MIKHVGKIGDRKVAIIFREVPGEEHMALIIYPDIMATHIHDSVMKVLESDVGQTADNLGEAMFRSLLSDGRPMLQTLHTEGMIKKVQAKQVIVTPTANSHVNLDELNKIINEMKMGEDAVKRLANLDAQQGMTGKVRRKDDFGREVGAPISGLTGANVAGSDAALALNDAALSRNMADQAARMEAEAKGLLAESARLRAQADAMLGEAPKAKRGRQKKVAAGNEA
jgi:hypothetical protein